MKKQEKNNQDLSRKDAIKKIGFYGKYVALTAMGTYMLLNPKIAQAGSTLTDPGGGFQGCSSIKLLMCGYIIFNKY